MIYFLIGLSIWLAGAIYIGFEVYRDYKFGGKLSVAFWTGVAWPFIYMLLGYVMARDFYWKMHIRWVTKGKIKFK